MTCEISSPNWQLRRRGRGREAWAEAKPFVPRCTVTTATAAAAASVKMGILDTDRVRYERSKVLGPSTSTRISTFTTNCSAVTSSSSPSPSRPSPILALPAELRLMIYHHLLPTHVTITYFTHRQRLVRQLSPTTSIPLLLTSRLIHNELLPLVTSRVTGILFDVPHRLFDASHQPAETGESASLSGAAGGGAWRSWREVSLCPTLIPEFLARGLREVELQVDGKGWVCRKCVEAQIGLWKERSPGLERVLVGTGVERLAESDVGTVAALVDVLRLEDKAENTPAAVVAAPAAMAEGVWERWGWLDQVGCAQTGDGDGVKVVLEFAVLGPVKMRCRGLGGSCGAGCFEANFVVGTPEISCRRPSKRRGREANADYFTVLRR